MENSLSITAVSGWALPPEWFHGQIEYYFPDAEIKVFYPSNPGDSQEAERLIKSAKSDLYIGYSLGSLWLMTYLKMLPETAVKVVLAPILAFCSERDRGGKTPETKLKYLIRRLARNPEDPSPLQEFYLDSKIQISDALFEKVPENEVLLKGLNFLHTAHIPDIDKLNTIALVGKEDGFLDGDKLKNYLPQLEIIPDAGHAPGPLLKRLANILNSTSHGQ